MLQQSFFFFFFVVSLGGIVTQLNTKVSESLSLMLLKKVKSYGGL
jgi:hypothetical protein